MSDEQQDAVLGRLLREYGNEKKRLVALQAEAERIGNYFTALGHALRKNHSLSAKGFGDWQGNVDLAHLPTPQHIQTLVDDLIHSRINKDSLGRKLEDAGFPSKD